MLKIEGRHGLYAHVSLRSWPTTNLWHRLVHRWEVDVDHPETYHPPVEDRFAYAITLAGAVRKGLKALEAESALYNAHSTLAQWHKYEDEKHEAAKKTRQKHSTGSG